MYWEIDSAEEADFVFVQSSNAKTGTYMCLSVVDLTDFGWWTCDCSREELCWGFFFFFFACLKHLKYIVESQRAMAPSTVTNVKTLHTVVVCWWQQQWAHLALITMVIVLKGVMGHAERQILGGIIILFSKPNERKGVAPQLSAVLVENWDSKHKQRWMLYITDVNKLHIP